MLDGAYHAGLLQRRGPDSVRDLGLRNIAVRTGSAAAFADVARAFKIVDFASGELVGRFHRLHFEIDDIEPRTARAKRAHTAIFWKSARRELYVAARSGADRIEPPDRGVFRGDCGND